MGWVRRVGMVGGEQVHNASEIRMTLFHDRKPALQLS
jgi:hypothetical protein